ncbi:MAG: hypothetical protein JWM80_6666 [Cyanobacteria bacterium RYN_339]|nr:hypothetical protein [Cyanobacteria bacterium RYN_339]
MRQPLLILVLTASLLGCGKQGGSEAPIPTAPLPTPAATPAVPDANAKAEGARLQATLKRAYDGCTGVEAEVKSFSEGHFKAGKVVSELRHATYRSHLIWGKPLKIRAEVLDTDNFLVGGARMATTDCKRVKVRGAGILGILPITLDATDDLLASNRNHRFTAMLPSPLIGHLLAGTWTALPGSDPHLAKASLVLPTHFDKEIDREELIMDATDGKLIRVTMYAKGRPVVDYSFTTFKWNPKTTADTFAI